MTETPDAAIQPGLKSPRPADNPEAPRVRLGGVLRGAHITLFGSGLGGILAIVNEIICARYLGVGTYGLYAFALIVARIAEGIATLGMPVGALHFLAIHREQNQPQLVWGTVIAAVLPPLVIGCLFSATLWTLAPWLASSVFGDVAAAPYIRALALAIPFMGLSEVLGVVTRGFGHSAYYVVVRSLVPPTVFLLSLLFIANRHAEPAWIPWAFFLAYVLATCAGVLAVRRVGGAALFRLRPTLPFKALYGYSMPVLMNQLLYLVVACTPILLLGAMQSDKDVGIFRACMQLVIPFDMVVIAFNAAAGNHYAVLEHTHKRAELAALVERITGFMAPLAMAWLLVLVLNRHEFLLLMGRDFVSGALTLAVLALGHATLCTVGTAGYLLVMSGRQRYETFNAAVAAVACVVLNVVLIRWFSSLGAAIATAVACLLVSALRILQVRRLTGIKILQPSLLRVLAIALVAGGIVAAVSSLLSETARAGLWGVAGLNALLAVVAGAMYWRVGMNESSRRSLQVHAKQWLARTPV